MQTILGSGGAIGIELAKSLKKFTSEIRLVSRNPKKVHPTDEIMPADLLNAAEVRKAFKRKKKAAWMSSLDYKHSFTYTPDAGRATAILGNTEDAYNQVWHLPTASDPLSGKEWIMAVGRELGVEPRYRIAPWWFVKIVGLFVPVMKRWLK